MGRAEVDTTLGSTTQVLEGSLRAAVETIGTPLFTFASSIVGGTRGSSAKPGTHPCSGARLDPRAYVLDAGEVFDLAGAVPERLDGDFELVEHPRPEVGNRRIV